MLGRVSFTTGLTCGDAMSVVAFSRKSAPDPEQDHHMHGDAFCMQCGHTWVAVAPVGATRLECPACHTEKGVMRFECAPVAGTEVRECNCGNQLFYLTRDGHMCANCGTYQLYD